ncbi:MAG: restriction endonuclease subunit S [Faecalicoccus sp.]|nr:restriction endonuclease subunit S [Faecalicoccus sp.]
MQPNKAGAVDATSLPSIPQTTRCHKGDILISNIRPYFKKIVYVSAECGCSTDVLCFSPNTSDLSAFLYGTLYVDHFFDYMVAGSKGTKMPRGDKQQIMNYPIVIPSEESLEAYNESISPMLEHIAGNRAENIRLVALRDTLLPRLMSGEIDVSDLSI